jgi:hypothetical protein
MWEIFFSRTFGPCTLRKAVEPRAEYKFGPDVRLSIEGCTAIWTFGKD